ncbi:MAG TPA: sn-glycerol-3-phosphate ABC transporter ATP-binding protein UgpC [Nitrospiraceae bacterium]|nr:sn-glycerol-3-phosphate ABC transporter ATP-binding protein UgpC [Nitrospiraceae bacterium]
MAFLVLRDVVKTFGAQAAVRGVSFEAEVGEFIVFVGPSGCGKSTLLRIIAGLEELSDGSVFIDGQDVTNIAPAERRVSMVFQSYALYPHMSVFQNMAFGLEMVRMPRVEIDRKVRETAQILQIESLLDRKPKQLSGGQRQRVAIGRAIVRSPKLFLFDEPLSNLDAELRTQMRVEIAKLHRSLGVTMVYVTHDQVEAMTLADRIVVLRDGLVEQVGSPSDLYDSPANTFVAGFIGSPKMNFFAGRVASVDGEGIALASSSLVDGKGRIAVRDASDLKPGDPVTFGIRPASFEIDDRKPLVEITADVMENLGGETQIYGKNTAGDQVVWLAQGRPNIEVGGKLRLGASNVYLFDSSGRSL